jgi:hypothetical protein
MIIISLLLFFQGVFTIHARLDHRVSFHYDEIGAFINIADSIANTLVPSPKKGHLLQKDEKWYLLFDGYSYLFEFHQEKIAQLYRGETHGYNFGSAVFFRSDTLFSYGGSGFWKFNPEIIFFDIPSGLWSNLNVKGEKPYFDGGVQEFAFLYGDKLVAFFAEKFPHSPIRERIPIKDGKLYMFDFDTNTWSKSNAMDGMTKVLFNYKIETDTYFVIYDSGFPVWLVDKKQMNLYRLPKNIGRFGFFDRDFGEKYHVVTKGDSVWVINRGFDHQILATYDFESDFNAIDKEKYLIQSKVPMSNYLFLVFILLILMVVIIFKIGLTLLRMISFPHPKFLFKINQHFAKVELEKVFELNEFGNNTELNKLLIIKKIKNPTDKRLFRYLIDCYGALFIYKMALKLFNRFFYNEEEVIEA